MGYTHSAFDAPLEEIRGKVVLLEKGEIRERMESELQGLQESIGRVADVSIVIARFCGTIIDILTPNGNTSINEIRQYCLGLYSYAKCTDVTDIEGARFLTSLYTAKTCSSHSVFYRSLFEELSRLCHRKTPEDKKRIIHILTFIFTNGLHLYFSRLERQAGKEREEERAQTERRDIGTNPTVKEDPDQASDEERDETEELGVGKVSKNHREVPLGSQILQRILQHDTLDYYAVISSLPAIKLYLSGGKEHHVRSDPTLPSWSAYASIR